MLSDIALFVEVVRTRSFTQAARQLAVPASTLSRRIALLEQQVGLRLLERTTRRVDVTEAGAVYFARCAALVDEARVAHEDLRCALELATGRLRLACPPGLDTAVLAPLLVAFTRAHPGVEVDLDTAAPLAALQAGQVDALLHLGPPPAEAALATRRLGLLARGLFAAPAYLQAAGQPGHPHALLAHQAVRLHPGAEADEGGRWLLQALDDSEPSQALAVPARLGAASPEAQRALVLAGAGIGLLAERAVADDLAGGRLQRVLPGWQAAPLALHLLTPSRVLPARVRLFAEALEQELAGGLARAPAPAAREAEPDERQRRRLSDLLGALGSLDLTP